MQKLPTDLVNSLQAVPGFDKDAFIATHASGAQLTSIRINPAKISSVAALSNFEHILDGPVPWSSYGYYLSSRPSFTADPAFHAGAYYVQEASSFFLEQAVKQSIDVSTALRVLDLCAAPGGKSTLLQSMISFDSLLVSNEVVKSRANILSENISKWGAANVVVTNNDPRDFQRLPGYFDVIVVDAPCSGSGLFRKDPDAVSEWSLSAVELCSQRQQRILADVLPGLKPGGVLVYATCSYSREEDEEICDWLLAEMDLSNRRLEIDPAWGIVETVSAAHNGYGYRFFPYLAKGEGFFLSVFQKKGGSAAGVFPKPKQKPNLATSAELQLLNLQVTHAELFSFFKWEENFIAVPASLLADVLLIQSLLYIKKAGVTIGSVIRNELIPAHEFALSGLSSGNFAEVNVTLAQALQYLRRAELKIDSPAKGWVLIRFMGLALGWAKILPNRINNYYPKEWRILNK